MLKIQGTQIADEFAEAFPMRMARLIVTADDPYWLEAAIHSATGYGCSVIGCDAEAGLDSWLSPDQTPDNRPGVALLFFGMSTESLGKALINRAGQCLMTCPTTSVFDGLPDAPKRTALGKHLRYFGDGYQKSKKVGSQRFWRVPVMDGEFLIQADCGIQHGVAGGNLILQGVDPAETAKAAARVAQAMKQLPGIIAPFPAGVVRSGSKVGSRYQGLFASTNQAYCPLLVGRVETQLHPDCRCAYEIVVDGDSQQSVSEAMKIGIQTACQEEILEVTAGNYGGKLGKFHFRLHDLVADMQSAESQEKTAQAKQDHLGGNESTQETTNRAIADNTGSSAPSSANQSSGASANQSPGGPTDAE